MGLCTLLLLQSAAADPVSRLVSWLQRHGTTGLSRVEIKPSSHGLGLFALSDFETDEILISVPRQLLISSQVIDETFRRA